MPYRLILWAFVCGWALTPSASFADEPGVPSTPRPGQRFVLRMRWDQQPAPARRSAPADRDVGRVQAVDLPAISPELPVDRLNAGAPSVGGQSLSLQAAMYGALTGNPDLVTLRQGSPIANAPSAEALEVARRFPTTLNPTVWIDYRPITLIPRLPADRAAGRDYYRSGQQSLYISYRQPVELGHQTTHRFAIARAALDQQNWTILQAELTALVQTYRLFQAAAYRRERLSVAKELADFNDRLLQTLQQRLDVNQVPAADVILARVESRAARQLATVARQDYLTALADLRNQVGVSDEAGAAEPLGSFTLPPYIPPVDEAEMVRTALANRPDIHSALSLVRGTEAATRLARADRIPTPVIGPEYQTNEGGSQFIGMVLISPLPIINNGTPLVRQREAEARRAIVALEQARQRVTTQVRAAVVKWNGAKELLNETTGLAKELTGEVAKLERLFDEGLADLTILLQGRQRLIQLENSRLDAVWAATQAQADLLLALGTPTLINAMLARAEAEAGLPNPSAATNPQPTSTLTPDTQ